MSMTIIMLVCFFILILLSVPIGWALGISSIAALLLSGEPFHIVLLASRLYNSTNSFVLMSLPFFILAGNIMSRGGLSKRLIQLCKTIIGPVHGGLGMVGILAAFFFSAISGSNAATTAAVGGMMIPELEKQGYPKDLSTATVAAAGTTGMVIPPSSAMVVFSATASVSLPALFMGGIIPGILMSGSMMLMVYLLSRRLKIQRSPRGNSSEIARSFLNAIGALLMPVIILGGIYSGVFTATEAAVVACVYSIIITVFVNRELKWKELPRIFWESAITSAVGMVVITCAAMFSYVITKEHMTEQLMTVFLNWTDNPVLLMLLINIVLLIAGCFVTPNCAIVILTPIVLPICRSFGINPVALGILMVVNLSIGAITPPVGGCVFVAASIANSSVESIFKRVMPYLTILLMDLLLLNLFDELTLFLPRIMGLM